MLARFGRSPAILEDLNVDPYLYKYVYYHLVGGFNHLEKYEFVNGKDDIPYMKWKIKMFETTNQLYIYVCIYIICIYRHTHTALGQGWARQSSTQSAAKGTDRRTETGWSSRSFRGTLGKFSKNCGKPRFITSFTRFASTNWIWSKLFEGGGCGWFWHVSSFPMPGGELQTWFAKRPKHTKTYKNCLLMLLK